MERIKITIEASKDLYSVYAADVEGLWGSGDTLAEAKESLLQTIEILKEENPEANWPKEIQGQYEFVYTWDIRSFLEHNKGVLSQSAIGRLSNISPKMLQHYYSGEKKPGPSQIKKIEEALHKYGTELIQVAF